MGNEIQATLQRGRDEFGNDIILFGGKPIRASFAKPKPRLVLADVLGACGFNQSNRRKLDIRGMPEYEPFTTPGGRQTFRVVDLDDAKRVTLQGQSEECRRFRDFVLEILAMVERGEPINAPAAPEPAPAPMTSGSMLMQLTGALHQVAIELNSHGLQITEAKRGADEAKEAAALAQKAAQEALDAVNGVPDKMTVLGFSKVLRLTIPSRDLATLGRLAAQRTADAGMEIGAVPHAHWGSVNTYPLPILEGMRSEFEARASKPSPRGIAKA